MCLRALPLLHAVIDTCLRVSVHLSLMRFNVRLNLSVVFKTSSNACGLGISFL